MSQVIDRVVRESSFWKAEFEHSLWMVCWRYKDGRLSGHGSPISKAEAEEAVRRANREYPEIHHWIIAA